MDLVNLCPVGSESLQLRVPKKGAFLERNAVIGCARKIRENRISGNTACFPSTQEIQHASTAIHTCTPYRRSLATATQFFPAMAIMAEPLYPMIPDCVVHESQSGVQDVSRASQKADKS